MAPASIIKWVMLTVIAAVVLILISLGLSVVVSPDLQQRFWRNVYHRTGEEMAFRFFLQPVMAVGFGVYDSVKEARAARQGSGGTSEERLTRGLFSTFRIVLLGIVIDVVYQMRVLKAFYPGEALMVTVPIVLIPYFFVRWLAVRTRGWWSS